MKTLKFTVLLLTILIINSCTDKDKNYNNEIEPETEYEKKSEDEGKITIPLGGRPNDSYYHILLLNFQDKSGNDLIKNWHDCIKWDGTSPSNPILFIKPELYELEIVVYEDTINYRKSGYDTSYGMLLYKGKQLSEEFGFIELNGDYDYLQFRVVYVKTMSVGKDPIELPFAEKIVFKFKCPYLFGNNETHDIITWWKLRSIDLTVFEDPVALCYRIELDGKEITEFYNTYGLYSVATVVLDR